MKTVYIGTQGGKKGEVFFKIEYTPKKAEYAYMPAKGVLSISGVIGAKANGNAWGSCGQILDDIKPIKEYAKGWNAKLLDKFLYIWKFYHLNNMNAGCEHQQKLGWGNNEISKPCPICGYKYGTAWKYQAVPKEFLDFLDNLPEASKKPAWI